MKKIVSIILFLFVVLLITGCGKSSGTIICKSEARGENPTIVNYEKYVVKNNKVVEYIKYNNLSYSDEYLSKIPMSTILEVYEKEEDLTVEKIDSKSIKTTFKNPRNYYEDIESDNMLETIRASLEDNAFNIYAYTCEIE